MMIALGRLTPARGRLNVYRIGLKGVRLRSSEGFTMKHLWTAPWLLVTSLALKAAGRESAGGSQPARADRVPR